MVGKSYDSKITGILKSRQQNSSKTVPNDLDKEIPKERYVSPDERQEIIDNLRSFIIV